MFFINTYWPTTLPGAKADCIRLVGQLNSTFGLIDASFSKGRHLGSEAMKAAGLVIRLLFFMGGTCSLAGCGGKTPLQKLGVGPLVPVQGKVMLGTKPLMGGNVFFYPEGEKKDYVPQGFIDSQGNYKMTTSGEPGAPLGKYRVTVEPASDDNRQNLQVDSVYTSFAKTPLTITVKENAPAGSYDLKLPLK